MIFLFRDDNTIFTHFFTKILIMFRVISLSLLLISFQMLSKSSIASKNI